MLGMDEIPIVIRGRLSIGFMTGGCYYRVYNYLIPKKLIMTKMFLDKSFKPTEEALSEVLGRSYQYWTQIQHLLVEQYGALAPEWKYYGAKSGWTLKMMLKKRNLFFFSPCNKYFFIAFVFGNNAVKAIEESDLSPAIIKEIKGAQRYSEGRGLRVEVRKREHIDDIIALTAIKANN